MGIREPNIGEDLIGGTMYLDNAMDLKLGGVANHNKDHVVCLKVIDVSFDQKYQHCQIRKLFENVTVSESSRASLRDVADAQFIIILQR